MQPLRLKRTSRSPGFPGGRPPRNLEFTASRRILHTGFIATSVSASPKTSRRSSLAHRYASYHCRIENSRIVAFGQPEAHCGPGALEKSHSVCLIRPYRKPTQVGECKRTQARERNLSKELGTLARNLRKKVVPQ